MTLVQFRAPVAKRTPLCSESIESTYSTDSLLHDGEFQQYCASK